MLSQEIVSKIDFKIDPNIMPKNFKQIVPKLSKIDHNQILAIVHKIVTKIVHKNWS